MVLSSKIVSKVLCISDKLITAEAEGLLQYTYLRSAGTSSVTSAGGKCFQKCNAYMNLFKKWGFCEFQSLSPSGLAKDRSVLKSVAMLFSQGEQYIAGREL